MSGLFKPTTARRTMILCRISLNSPTAVVQSVATEAPFDPNTDPELGIACKFSLLNASHRLLSFFSHFRG